MIDLLLEAMARHPEAKGFLIDGFPANLEQANICQEKLGRPQYGFSIIAKNKSKLPFPGKSLFSMCLMRS